MSPSPELEPIANAELDRTNPETKTAWPPEIFREYNGCFSFRMTALSPESCIDQRPRDPLLKPIVIVPGCILGTQRSQTRPWLAGNPPRPCLLSLSAIDVDRSPGESPLPDGDPGDLSRV